jgi:hypothetical protein
MTTEAKIQVTSSELGTLWITYTSISARLIMYDFFKNKTIDKEASLREALKLSLERSAVYTITSYMKKSAYKITINTIRLHSFNKKYY